nr:DUF3987 domain-containing protein [Clostridia bacterium]
MTSTIPREITEKGLFCCWRYEERNGKQTKVPYNPRTGERAKSNDPQSFADYLTASCASHQYDGMGLGIFNGICAIDLDHCIDAEGNYSQTAAEIIAMMHSYTELSPSGTGVHILFRAEGFRYNTNRYFIMNRQAGIEVYVAGATNKYVTITGQSCAAYEFGDRSDELQQVLERFMVRSQPAATNAINAVNSPLTTDQLLEKAFSSRRGEAIRRLWSGDTTGYPSHSEADQALCSHLAFWTGRDAGMMDAMFRQSGLMRDKWDRKQAGSTYGQITIQTAIRNCTEVYTPKGQRQVQPTPAPVVEAEEPKFLPMKPLTPQSSELPPFPVDYLPEPLRSYVSAVAEHSQTSPDMAAVIGLGTLAVCLQGKYRVEGSPGYYEPLSLYTVVIAPPGERKSSVMNDMTRALRDYADEYNRARATDIKANRRERESLQRQINAQQKKLEQSGKWEDEAQLNVLNDQLEALPELKPARFFADDCSSEALTSLMAENGGVISVISTEGGVFDMMNGRYSNKVNIDVWLKGHCGDTIYVDRKCREAECIARPALSAILSIQPCVLEEIMTNATMSGRGLIARFLYASPPSRIGSRSFTTKPIPPEVEADYRSMIYRLMALDRPEEPRTLMLAPGATEQIAEHFQHHERFLVGEGQAISDWASKYIGAVLRIAGLIHAAEMQPEGSPLITEATITRAICIGQYFLQHSLYAYSMMGTDLSIQKARFVLAKLCKKEITQIKRSELFQMCRGKFFKKTEELLPTLELLVDHGYIRMEEPEHFTVGRPPDTRIFVNPDAVI